MSLLSKLFCNHKWKSHDKRERTISTQIMPYSDQYQVTREFTREILICECCGKIKTIEY